MNRMAPQSLREECIVELILLGTTSTLFSEKSHFFIQHLFYHFSPFSYPFFNIYRPLSRILSMEKQSLVINDLYSFCHNQQREINNEIPHGHIGALF